MMDRRVGGVRQDPARLRPVLPRLSIAEASPVEGPSDVKVLQADSSKFRALNGWKPESPFERTMETCWIGGVAGLSRRELQLDWSVPDDPELGMEIRPPLIARLAGFEGRLCGTPASRMPSLGGVWIRVRPSGCSAFGRRRVLKKDCGGRLSRTAKHG